jgi:hypothetical protein
MSSKKTIKQIKDRISHQIEHTNKQREKELEQKVDELPGIRKMLFEMVRLLRKQKMEIPEEQNVWVMNPQKQVRVVNPDDIKTSETFVANLDEIEIPKPPERIDVKGFKETQQKTHELLKKQNKVLNQILVELKNLRDDRE